MYSLQRNFEIVLAIFFLNKENVKNDAITTVYIAQWVELSNIHIFHNSSFLKDLSNEEIMLVCTGIT